jgi:hypothetical protein
MAMHERKFEEEAFTLYAVVAPGSHTNARYSFEIAGWQVHDRSVDMVFCRRIPHTFPDTDVYQAVQDLENILLALFASDRLPRKIFYFSYPKTIPKESSVRLLFLLGQPKDEKATDQDIAKQSFSHSGFMLNRRIDELDGNWLPSNSSIEEWFNRLHEKESLAGSIALLQKSFWTINGLQGKYRYYDYLDLCEAVVLMVAGLESLFVQGASAEVSFQFRLVGATYYVKFAKEDDLRNFSQSERKKLTFIEMKTLLGHLYDVRSQVSHGQARNLFASKSGKGPKKWQKILACMHVADTEPEDKTMFFGHVLLALSLVQLHIFAMISRLKDHPMKGLAIFDEIFSDEPEAVKAANDPRTGKT